MLSDTTESNPVSFFYVHDQGSPVKNYIQGVQACQDFGKLATLSSNKTIEKALKLISNTKNVTTKGFWINSDTRLHFEELKIAGLTGNLQDNCMVITENPEEPSHLQIKWESCFDTQEIYGVLCEAHFGGHYKKVDSSCLQTLQTPLLEYRVHLGPELNGRDVSCTMKVDYRKGHTCYKKTDELLGINIKEQICTLTVFSLCVLRAL